MCGAGALAPTLLDCAVGEQAWIESELATDASATRIAISEYRTPALILGRRSQLAATPLRAQTSAVPVVSRRTGGGAVFAGPWMLGFHIVLPTSHALSAASHVSTFIRVGEAVRAALSSVAIDSALPDRMQRARSEKNRDLADLAWSCFAGLSYGELVDAHGLKALGLAQARLSRGTIVSGGLLLDDTPWEELEFLYAARRIERSSMRELASSGLLVERSAKDRHALLTAISQNLCALTEDDTKFAAVA